MLQGFALLLTVATGTSGLVYEVTWEHMLAVLLGSHAEATATVLAFFLGGLALGYARFGAWSRRLAARGGRRSPRELLSRYGVVEATIGAYALVFELPFDAARALSLHGPAQPALAFAWDAALSAALIVPGAALMGATIPMLTQALARDVRDATRIHAAIYGLNTLGACFGALAASYWLIPALGLVGTLRGMGLVNLAAGLGYVALALRAPRVEAPVPSAAAARASPQRQALLCLVAALLGFAMMTVQTALIRMGNVALGASLFTFASVVAAFVLCIALGSLAVGLLPRVPAGLLPACAWGVFALLAWLYLPLQDAPFYAHRLRIAFRDHPAAFPLYHLAVFAALLAALGPALVLSGALLPLIFDRLRREQGELGDAAGRIYGWNTVGSLAGALVGGYALFYWLDLEGVYRVALVALAAAAALLTPPLLARARAGQPIALAALAAIALRQLPDWDPLRLAVGAFRIRRPTPESFTNAATFAAAQFPGSRIAFYDDDPVASISVRESHDERGQLHRSILTNGKSDGSVIGDYTTTALIALVPAWLARQAGRAFVIGYGTGVTASELARLDESREVVVAEISPGVAAARSLFDYANHDASTNPKIRLVRGDAYRVLQRSDGRFDVIASEPSNPWVNGVEMLYSLEFLRAARAKLSPGGVYCQWFHSYEIDEATVELVLRTYAAVFDHVAVWYALGTDLLLLGFDDPGPALDLPRLAQRAARPDFRDGFARAGIGGFAALLAHELWPIGVLHALDLKGPVHTLLHPRLSHMAARAFFVATSARLPPAATPEAASVGALHSLLRQYALARGGLPESERAAWVRETCALRVEECMTRLAAWRSAVPESQERDALEAWLRDRKKLPRLYLDLPPELARFYASVYEAPPPQADFAKRARRESERFIEYFDPVAPFQRSALASLFDWCADSRQAALCAGIRREVEARIGPLEDR